MNDAMNEALARYQCRELCRNSSIHCGDQCNGDYSQVKIFNEEHKSLLSLCARQSCYYTIKDLIMIGASINIDLHWSCPLYGNGLGTTLMNWKTAISKKTVLNLLLSLT